MKVRVQVPVTVSAEVSIDGDMIVMGVPVIEAGEYLNSIDTNIGPDTKLYRRAIEAIRQEMRSYMTDKAGGL